MPLTGLVKRGRSFAVAVLSAAVAVGLVGCTDSGSDEVSAVKNQVAWKMPLDDFYVYPTDLDNYAEQLLIADCVTGRGYQWPVPWQNVEFPRGEDFTPLGLRLFTPELAKKWGYHFARPGDEKSAKLWEEFVETTDGYFPNPELDDALFACTDDIRNEDEDFSVNFDGHNYLAELAVQADRIVEQDEGVVEATAAWSECLAPQVDFTLPKDPWSEMPPISLSQKWGIEIEATPEPSTEELDAAIADANCRESSGLSKIRYERNWEEQQKLVDQNRDKLNRIRSKALERKEKLLTIVAKKAPTAN